MALSSRWRLGSASLLLVAILTASPTWAQQTGAPSPDQSPAPLLPEQPPGAFKADPTTPDSEPAPDVWIFSGELHNSRETYSGTLVASKSTSEFELRLGSGATCDGTDLKGDLGLVRLSEISCSDDRALRALFVPQGSDELKVFGHVGNERFMTTAHLLGTEPVPEKKQTAEPRAPMGRPPGPPMPATPPPKNGPG